MSTRLARGQRVGNRYRLERELGRGTDGMTWEAIDERLDRRVALRIFDAGLERQTIVKRAGIAASLTHPRVVRVFDTGEDGGRFFTVSELVPESLHTAQLPLPAEAALQTATDIAEALHYAHERGVVHGHLHEGNILLSEGGAKVGDFALGASGEHTDRDDDLRSLGALMRRVTLMPDPSAPPGLARVVEGLASGAYTSAAEALSELRALRPPSVTPRRQAPSRSWLALIAAVLLGLIAFGVLRLGERSPDEELIPGGRIEGTPLPVIGIRDFDPETSDADKEENPDEVRNAIDADPQTFWSTEGYGSGPNFSGLKNGVGLILDVGKPTDVGKAQILWVAQGCSFDLRHSDDKTAAVGEWATAHTVTDSPISAPIRFEAAKAQYWLLWITRLAQSGNTHRCGVKDIDLFSP